MPTSARSPRADGSGPVQDFLAATAQRLQLWIVGGTVPLRAGGDGRVAAASLVYDADGRRVARYDKIHLFDVDIPGRSESYRESAHVAPGAPAAVIDTPVGRLGLSVCYDVRFPELYRHLSAAGAQLLSVPSAFTSATGRAHWETLLRARAIENLCYVIAPAQSGFHPSGRETYGDSMIVDFWGRDPAAPAARPRRRGRRGRPGSARRACAKAFPRSFTAPLPKEYRTHELNAAATDPLSLARELILRPSGLDDRRLDQVFGEVLAHSVDFADLYFQLAHQESWSLEDGIVKDGSASIEQGVGVRALAGEKTGFAYSDEIILPALEEASRAARAIAVARRRAAACSAWRAQAGHQLYLPGGSGGDARRPRRRWRGSSASTARRARHRSARRAGDAPAWSAVHEVILIATSDGELAADVRPLVRFNVSVLVEQNGRREQGYAGCGGRFSLAELVAGERAAGARARGGAPGAGESGGAAGAGRHHDRRARPGLAGNPAARGHRPRTRGRFQPQGHLGVRRAASASGSRPPSARWSMTARCRAAAARSTSTTRARRRSAPRSSRTASCAGYMQDRLNARLMGVAPTGNGRRESFAHLTLPRMTNTYMRPGPHAPEDIIASVERGIYAVNFGGGQVDITSGKFVFSASEAYEIENGTRRRAAQGRHAHRQRPDVLTRVIDGGQRPEARRRHRHLRQGRAERAGRRRSADAADRRAHGRRHRLNPAARRRRSRHSSGAAAAAPAT